MKLPILFAAATALALSGCAGATYKLVSPGPAVAVAGNAMIVAPSRAWNKTPRGASDIPQEENWTANGPLLDMLSFVGGVSDGQPIVRQRRREQQRVPTFRADMTPQDVVSMIESFYRIRNDAANFEVTAVQPAQFVGSPATRMDFDYVGADGLERRGRAVAAIVNGKLYMMALDGARLHYFGAAAGEFDALTASARIRG
jgi:hypothetical protein